MRRAKDLITLNTVSARSTKKQWLVEDKEEEEEQFMDISEFCDEYE